MKKTNILHSVRYSKISLVSFSLWHVSKSNTIFTPLKGRCPFFFQDRSFSFKRSSICSSKTQHQNYLWRIRSDFVSTCSLQVIVLFFCCCFFFSRICHTDFNDFSLRQTVTSQMRVWWESARGWLTARPVGGWARCTAGRSAYSAWL